MDKYKKAEKVVTEADMSFKRLEELDKLFNILGIDGLYDAKTQEIYGAKLRTKDVIDAFHEKIYELREFYPSDKLTALHSNSLEKQKFPGVNLLRQMLKYNGYHLKPFVRSLGYNKGKKIILRNYVVVELEK